MKAAGLVALFAGPASNNLVSAFPMYQSSIPNGDNVMRGDQSWPGVGHISQWGGGPRNVFGWDFAGAGYQWTQELCEADSDGDGQTNGMELGDPDCVWTQGGATPARVANISHPGFVDSMTSVPSPGGFEPADGGVGRTCRGATEDDNDDGYYVEMQASSLEECQLLCSNITACKGIEFASFGRCELWTRDGGIGTTAPVPSYLCLRLVGETFVPADSGSGRLCRGANESDTLPEYYIASGSKSLAECKDACKDTPSCSGIEHTSRGRCEVWTRNGGIGATQQAPDFTCMRRTSSLALRQTGSVQRKRTRGAARKSGHLGTALIQEGAELSRSAGDAEL